MAMGVAQADLEILDAFLRKNAEHIKSPEDFI
jgi:hypothetical protein